MAHKVLGIVIILTLLFTHWFSKLVSFNLRIQDGGFYALVSAYGETIFLSASGISLKKIDELSLIIVRKGGENKREPRRLEHLKYLRKLDFNIKKANITLVDKFSKRLTYVNADDISISKGLIKVDSALIMVNANSFRLFNAYGKVSEDGTVHLSSASLEVYGARINMSGSWDGKNYGANAELFVNKDEVKAEGKVSLVGFGKALFGDLKLSGEAFSRSFSLAGKFSGEGFEGELLALGGNFRLRGKKDNLRVSIDHLELAQLNKELKGKASLEAQITKNGWEVSLLAPIFELRGIKLSMLSVGGRGVFNPAPEGRVLVNSKELSFEGRISNRVLSGQWRTAGLERGSLRFWMEGSLLFDKGLSLKGAGRVEGVEISGFKPKDAFLEFIHDRGKTSFSLSTREFRAIGDLDGQLANLKLRPTGETISFRGVNILSPSGEVKLELKSGQLTNLEGRIELGAIYHGIKAKRLKLSLSLLENLPSFEGEASLELFGQEIKNASIKGKVSKGGLIFTLASEQLSLSLDAFDKNFNLRSKVSILRPEFTLRGELTGFGKADELRFSFAGFSQVRGFELPLNIKGSISDSKAFIQIDGFSARRELWSLSVSDIRLFGPIEKIALEPFFVRAYLGGYSLLSMSFGGSYLKDGVFNLRGALGDGARGDVELSLSQRGIYARLDGFVELSQILGIIKSKTGLSGSGTIKVFGELKNGRPYLSLSSSELSLRSKFVGVPMSGGLELRYDAALSGRLDLKGPEGASAQARFGKDEIDFRFSRLPIIYKDERVKALMFVWSEGSYKNGKIVAKVSHGGGDVRIEKISAKVDTKQAGGIDYEIELSSREPLRVNLPEGQLYAKLSGKLWRGGYDIKASLPSGKLRYFDRDFYIQRGNVQIKKDNVELALNLASTLPDYTLIIDIIGDPRFPKVLVRSEPPLDIREVLAGLLRGGSSQESLIAVGLDAIPELSGATRQVQRLTGLDIKLEASPAISPSGEVGVNLKLKKELGQRGSVEYQASTLKSPKESFVGGDLKVRQGISIGGRIYSDNSQEVRLRLRRKFDF